MAENQIESKYNKKGESAVSVTDGYGCYKHVGMAINQRLARFQRLDLYFVASRMNP